MKRNTLLIAGAAVLTAAAVGLGGAALANAGNTSTATPTATATSSTGAADKSGQGRHGRGVGNGQGLSGDTAVKVVQAAVAKEPTAVLLRAAKAADGTYRVAMRRTDGTRIMMSIDANFAVTSTQEQAAKPHRTAKPTTTATGSPTS